MSDSARPTLRSVELHILLSVVDRPRHGYAILQEAEERTGGRPGFEIPTLYRALRRMGREGLIRAADRPEPDAAERARRGTKAGVMTRVVPGSNRQSAHGGSLLTHELTLAGSTGANLSALLDVPSGRSPTEGERGCLPGHIIEEQRFPDPRAPSITKAARAPDGSLGRRAG